MAKKDFGALAQAVIEQVGGKENITYLTHCITRLRFNLKDRGLADLEKIKGVSGVLGVQWSGDQLQIIIGQSVEDAYNAICEKTGLEKREAVDENLDGDLAGTKKKISVASVLDKFSGCLTPLIPMMVGSGMIKVLIMVLTMTGLLSTESATYTSLTFISDAGFYFFPILIGATAAKKFGANMGIGMMLGGILVHPTFVALVSAGTEVSIFGLPVYGGSYTSSVFPIILTMAICGPVERFIAKHTPDAIRSFAEPLITLLVMAPLMLCVLAPIGSVVGDVLIAAIMWLYDTVGFVGTAVLGGLFPLLVMTGMHASLTPYLLSSFATLGYEPIAVPANFVANYSIGAACAAVALKAKDPALKSTGATCTLSVFLGGVTEPGLFGIAVPLKTPLYCAMLGGFVGGAVSGLLHVAIYAFPGSGSVLALPIFIGESAMTLVNAVISMVVGMVVAFISTMIFYKPEEKKA